MLTCRMWAWKLECLKNCGRAKVKNSRQQEQDDLNWWFWGTPISSLSSSRSYCCKSPQNSPDQHETPTNHQSQHTRTARRVSRLSRQFEQEKVWNTPQARAEINTPTNTPTSALHPNVCSYGHVFGCLFENPKIS